MFSFTEYQIFTSLTAATILRNAQLCITQQAEIFRLLCCNIDFSELSVHLNSTNINRVLFYANQKICNLSLFSELGSYLICLYTIGP